mmetsp:Transcript_1366/g.2659  ORF Transcript_1366/g.2659 Transcript_1366/m.2659 type:complete len:217 (-) Transcript_1366:86-736(-)
MESAASPFRIAFLNTSPDPPPDFSTASISSEVASGFTICTWRLTFFLISVLYFCCAFWYSFITSTNLRVRVLTRFSRTLNSATFVPLVSFMASVCSFSFCSSCFERAAFLLVSFTSGVSSVLSSASLSDVVASTTCWLISPIRLVEMRMARMFCFTISTVSKNSCMKESLAMSDSPPPVSISSATCSGAAAPLFSSLRRSFITNTNVRTHTHCPSS